MTDTAPSSPPPTSAPRTPGVRRAFVRRWGRRLLLVATAVLAAGLVSFFTIDLGRLPKLKSAAEKYASTWLDRPMHIGGMSVRPAAGEYILHDVEIDGVAGGAGPFFTAKTIVVRTSLAAIFSGQFGIEVDLHDWQMSMERWSDHHNIPRLGGPKKPPQAQKKKGPISYRVSARAFDGRFLYTDHSGSWSVVAPNLGFAMDWSTLMGKYVGNLNFHGGTVQIQDFKPMSADLATRFVLEGSVVTMPHIDLKTDGADSHITGQVDFSKLPEQSYTVSSEIDFARMKDIFFARESWRVKGTGHFAGVFNLYRDARGRDLSGDFTSDEASVNGMPFTNLHGSLVWLPSRFAVTHADADLYGGRTRFLYAIEPLGTPQGSVQKFAADLERVDLRRLHEVVDLNGLELDGRARGHVAMAWPSGHLKEGIVGDGTVTTMPPEGVSLATAELPAGLAPPGPTPGEFKSREPIGRLPVGADLTFNFDPEGFTFSRSTIATPSTFVSLTGRAAYSGAADFPFHVTSHDWQASDRLLAAILTAAKHPSDAVEVGGAGTFDGGMTGSFTAPRIAGHFNGTDVSAWKVVWGRGQGDVVIENRYLDLTNGVITRGDASICADGRFSLGLARADGGDEIGAHVEVTNWPLNDLRVAFKQQAWPIDGQIASARFDLHGKFSATGFFGQGPLTLANGTAWNEHFDTATADLEFNGPIVDVSHLRVAKGTGTLAGTAAMGWDGTYSFNVDVAKVPIESLDNFKTPRAPLTGLLSGSCDGKGTFDAPAYYCRAEVPDLAIGDQGIGQTHAEFSIADNLMTIDRLDAKSNRLDVRTNGQIRLTAPYDTVFHGRFEDASIDPYFKFIKPKTATSPDPAAGQDVQYDFVHAIVSGDAHVKGPLQDIGRMQVDAQVDKGVLQLYDYALHNDGPLLFSVSDRRLSIAKFALQGENTSLTLSGGVSMADTTADLRASGDVNLKILRSTNVSRALGTAKVDAQLRGSFDTGLTVSGAAQIAGGEIRYGTLPSLTDVNGTLTFEDNTVNADGLHAKMGTGPLTFGGGMLVNFSNFPASVYRLRANGTGMVLHYPEGFTSKVDADLSLLGPVTAPRLDGQVNVISATYTKRIDTATAGFLGLAAGGGGLSGSGAAGADQFALTTGTTATSEPGYVVSYDVHISAPPSSLVIDSGKDTHIEAEGDLGYHGEGDRAVLTGHVTIDKGKVTWNANKFDLQSGTINFQNPVRTEPNFDITAVTRPRAPGQTYVVNLHLSGTTSKLSMQLGADPWLSEYDIVRLLIGESPTTGNQAPETRALNAQQDVPSLVQSLGAQLLASPILAPVSSVFSTLPGAPTVAIAPIIGGEIGNTTTTARVVIGQEISSVVYLTYLRTLNQPNEFIQIEVQQSDSLSWVLSRNEDRTYAFGFRIRRVLGGER